MATSNVPGVQTDKGAYSASAFCTICKAVSSFDPFGTAHVVGRSLAIAGYQRSVFYPLKCARCGKGAMAHFADNGNAHAAVLVEFSPRAIEYASFRFKLPPELESEFREAELCAGNGANRAAAALYRSTLEKVLKANGYRKEIDPKVSNLLKGIDAACGDNLISEARRKRAHEDVRILGNDVLHDDWREVTNDEIERAHRYTQRILEDFYDDRETVLKALKEKKRIPEEGPKDSAAAVGV